MSDTFIYEFLFRGGESSKPDDDTWHVVLARPYEDVTGATKLDISEPLSPARAEALGFPLSRIIADLNQTAVNAAGELANVMAKAKSDRDEYDRAMGVARSAVEAAELNNAGMRKALEELGVLPGEGSSKTLDKPGGRG